MRDDLRLPALLPLPAHRCSPRLHPCPRLVVLAGARCWVEVDGVNVIRYAAFVALPLLAFTAIFWIGGAR